jgi:hypothetical protein
MATISGDAGTSAPLVPDRPRGVWGQSDNGYGVAGTSATSSGVQGGSISGFGTVGTSNSSYGLVGESETGDGLYARGGRNAAILDGAVSISGVATVQVLEITGGGDLAEDFACNSIEAPAPGTVMVICEESPGTLAMSSKAMDPRVAGVVSGARGLNSGLTLRSSVAGRSVKVALAGRVYCRCEAVSRPIGVGDRLVTSALPGYAMALPHDMVSEGTVLGKAMTSLAEGTGLVLALVNLQ